MPPNGTDPASLVGAFSFQTKPPLCLQKVKRGGPEAPSDDIRFPVEQVVEYEQPGNGFKMGLNDLCRELFREKCNGMLPSLNLVEDGFFL